MAVKFHSQPPTTDSSMVQLSLLANMPAKVRCTKIKN
jgi:hypothetical protein